jgi:phosphoglycerate dehydrogenase-like enzyme
MIIALQGRPARAETFETGGETVAMTDGATTSGAMTEGAMTEGAMTEGAMTEGAMSEGAMTSGAITRVAVLDDYQRRARGYADWGSLGPGVEVAFFHDPMDQPALIEALAGFEVLVLMRERTAFPRAVLEALPKLRLLVTTGMRNASVDIGYLSERGVVVSGTGGQGGPPAPGIPSTAEVAWALILAVSKRVTLEDRAIREGRWQLDLPSVLAGATLGLAGLGHLGPAMIAPAQAFGMEVIAWSQNLTGDRATAVGARKVSKEELLSNSDFLSVHLVLSERTRGLFQATDLALMKPTAVLINTSRGPIIDETALIAALRNGTIAGAGLDVYDREPLPAGHELTTLGNVVLLPHLGYANEGGFRQMYGQVVEDIDAFLRGSPVRTLS